MSVTGVMEAGKMSVYVCQTCFKRYQLEYGGDTKVTRCGVCLERDGDGTWYSCLLTKTLSEPGVGRPILEQLKGLGK